MDLSTVLVVSTMIRLVAVPVSITELRRICSAAINPIQLVVMRVSLYPAPSSVTAAFLYEVAYELEFFLRFNHDKVSFQSLGKILAAPSVEVDVLSM